MPQEDALRIPTPKRFASGGISPPPALPPPDPKFVRSHPAGGEAPIAEHETYLTKRWEAPLYVEPANTGDFDPFGPPPALYTERHTRIKVEGGQLDLGLVKVEPWRWWMRFVPCRPRAVNYLRSFPPGPTQDEDAWAWWESLR
jgi:hypothetical protein